MGRLPHSFGNFVPQAADRGPNPYFRESSQFSLQMHWNPSTMVCSYNRLVNELEWEVRRQTARENDGVSSFFETSASLTNPITGHVLKYIYRIPFTPKSGLFVVMLLPPKGWEEVTGTECVELLFDFRDLYLLGFMHEDIWYLFKDARVEESPPFVVRTTIDSGYKDRDHKEVIIGINGLWETYQALSNASHRSQNEIWIALFRIVTVISEALRFRRWLARMLIIFKNGLNVTVDCPKDDPRKVYSRYFTDWSSMCKQLKDGEETFKPQFGCESYERLSWEILLILSRSKDD
ncbi:hypothetical protein ACP4OV_017382 [Aristida adscensionis]